MQQYLLRRRLRHLRSVAIQNISFRNSIENFLDENPTISACFIIQNREAETIYVSELISGPVTKVQVNELRFDKAFGLLDRFVIELAIKIPTQLLKNQQTQVLTIVKKFDVELENLSYLGSHPKNYIFPGVNVLLIELQDGWYTTSGTVYRTIEHQTVPKLNIDHNKCKKSCSYNSLLKLTKLLQYVSDIDEERKNWAIKIDALVEPGLESKKRSIADIKTEIERINYRCETKRKEISQLNKNVKNVESLMPGKKSFDILKDAALDEYGTIYATLSNTNEFVEKLQLRKCHQLIGIFENTILFSEKYGLVVLKSDSGLAGPKSKLVLKTVDVKNVTEYVNEPQEVKDKMNVYLGYYSLFILIYSRYIIRRPLPYDIKFVGNRSLIGKKYSLCCPNSHSLRVKEEVMTAIQLFNKNIVQVINYIQHISEFSSL